MEEVPAVEKVVESRGPKKGVLLIDGGGSDAKVDYTGPPTENGSPTCGRILPRFG